MGRRRAARPAATADRGSGGDERWRSRSALERTYGNWRRPRPPGLWHLGLISSVLLFAGLIAVIIVIALVGLIPGLVLLAVMLPVFLVTLRPDPHGQTPLQRARDEAGWRRARGEPLASVPLRAAGPDPVGHLSAARAAGRQPAVGGPRHL